MQKWKFQVPERKLGLCKMHLPGNMSGLERIVREKKKNVLMGEMKPTTHVSGSLPILSKAHLV